MLFILLEEEHRDRQTDRVVLRVVVSSEFADRVVLHRQFLSSTGWSRLLTSIERRATRRKRFICGVYWWDWDWDDNDGCCDVFL